MSHDRVDSAGLGAYNFRYHSRERLVPHKEEDADHDVMEGDGEQEGHGGCCGCSISGEILRDAMGLKLLCNKVSTGFHKGWEFAKSDPRKVIFSVKMGMALSLVSLLMFINIPYKDISTYSVWAILTVVVVFEFTIGATLSKGFNRGLGTFSAGGLAFGAAELSLCTGKLEPVMIIISIFIAGSGATFAKLYPKMKPYEYGFRVFLITFCFVMVSGYRTGEFIHTAINRFVLILLGAAVSLVVNTCVYPIWAGEDLHNLIVKNFMAVANSLEGCIDGYLSGIELERVPSKILTCQAADDPVYSGYRSAVVSATEEETLEGFASWEPPHGRYKKMKYPWKQYVKVGGALRHCAYMIMALHGCLLSEIQAPIDLRQVFSNELRILSCAGANVLRELGNNIDRMTKLKVGDILVQVHKAAEELQKKIDARSYLLVNSESWVIGSRNDNDDYIHAAFTESDDVDQMMKDEEGGDQIGNLSREYDESGNRGAEHIMVNVLSKSWDCQGSHFGTVSSGKVFNKQRSWPSRPVVDFEPSIDREEKTLESARALSVATFASLSIEFVARLDNLVKSFNDLSVEANFEEPPDDIISPLSETNGIFQRLLRLFR